MGTGLIFNLANKFSTLFSPLLILSISPIISKIEVSVAFFAWQRFVSSLT